MAILTEEHLETTKWGRALVDRFGRERALEFIDFLRNNGFTMELPVQLEKLSIGKNPEVELIFLDSKGNPISESDEGDIARIHRWYIEINGEPQKWVKSVEIPKLDYAVTDVLTFKLEYYAVIDEDKFIKPD